jgi:hypothetical protein
LAIDVHILRFLLVARAEGVDFSRTLTIGRQDFHFLTADQIVAESGRAALSLEPKQVAAWLAYRHIDPLLHRLGAAELDALDASDYEGATVVHDLLKPIPDHLANRYTVVFEAGSLEHVFDAPAALRNLTRLVAPGGHLIAVSPANNWMGHGFYQFSPEWYWRGLSEQNGFQVERAIVTETYPAARWYEAPDPAAVHRNVELRNDQPTFVMVRARKTQDVPFHDPVQAVYDAAWKDEPFNQPQLWRRRRLDRLRGLVWRVARKLCGPDPFEAPYYRRRVLQGEQVPNSEKLFSMFEPHTQLYKRGKAGEPVQFGRLALVYEDGAGFITHAYLLGRVEQDRDVIVPQTRILQQRLKGVIEEASFDRGFHTPENQRELAKIIARPCLLKPGKKQAAEQSQQATVSFRRARQRHAGVESAIGALQAGNGLERSRDRTERGLERYLALGVLGRNLHVLGKLLITQEASNCEAARSQRGKTAA